MRSINATATDKVEIDGGSVDGDIIAPRVAIADGRISGAASTCSVATQPQQQGSQAQRSGALVTQQVPPQHRLRNRRPVSRALVIHGD